jgi:hypothetical protein
METSTVEFSISFLCNYVVRTNHCFGIQNDKNSPTYGTIVYEDIRIQINWRK